ncbi:MAG TPA: GatB/YqeY domain-containing protein [Herpetosiphonaceae bacterium]
MAIVEQLTNDMKEAMRAKDQQRLDTIRMALASIKNARIDLGRDLDEDEALKVLQKEAKRRRDAAESYHAAKRPDLAEPEERELALLEAYLPKLMGADALRPLVAAVIAEVGATGPGDLSKLMPVLMSRFKGQAEGRTLNQVARELLTA